MIAIGLPGTTVAGETVYIHPGESTQTAIDEALAGADAVQAPWLLDHSTP